MQKLICRLFLLFALTSLSSCRASTIELASTPTTPPTQTATLTPTLTPVPSRTPIPSPTPVWKDELGTPIVINNYYGVWSPTANELVGIQSTDPNKGNLALISAPDFNINPYKFAGAEKAWDEATWSPDGQTILFGIPTMGDGLGIDIWSDLWAVNRNGSNLRQLPGSYRGLDFPWWIDNRTVVATSYSGGGHEVIAEVDYLSGKLVVSELLHNYYMPRPQGKYLPVVGAEALVTTTILTQSYTREFPTQIIKADYADVYFQDWQPGKSIALVNVEGYKNEWGTRLFLWNIKNNHIVTLIPGGLRGRFSPDGQNVLFTTSGAPSLYTTGKTDTLSLDKVSEGNTIYLQLMDFQSHQIRMSIPTMTREEFNNLYLELLNNAEFSPDSRYLVFRSLGKAYFKDSVWSSDYPATKQPYLNILDLQQNKLIFSLESDSSWNWSPTSNQLLLTDKLGNWLLFDLSKSTISLVFKNDGEDTYKSPAWSFDGHYLSIAISEPGYSDKFGQKKMLIFSLP